MIDPTENELQGIIQYFLSVKSTGAKSASVVYRPKTEIEVEWFEGKECKITFVEEGIKQAFYRKLPSS